jgi:hypothetical protein
VFSALTAFCWLFRCVDWEKACLRAGVAVVIGVLVDVYGDVRSAPHRREFSLRDLDTLMVSGRSEIRVEDDIRFLSLYKR